MLRRPAPGLALAFVLALPLAVVSPLRAARADGGRLDGYPAALIDRPLTLPRLVVQPILEGALTNGTVDYDSGSAGGLATAGGLGGAIGFGLDVGVTDRLQVGFFCGLPLVPVADFGTFAADVQYAVVPGRINLRLDLGVQREVLRYTVVGSAASSDFDGFVLGAGLPLRVRVHRMLAITSGDPSARGWRIPAVVTGGPAVAGGAPTTLFGNTLATEDVLSLGFWSEGGVGRTVGAIHLPIGLLFQPHPVFALGVRTGYRLAFTIDGDGNGGSSTTVVHFVPVALDAIFSIGARVDIGLTASLAGSIGGDTYRGYADVRQFELWLTARL